MLFSELDALHIKILLDSPIRPPIVGTHVAYFIIQKDINMSIKLFHKPISSKNIGVSIDRMTGKLFGKSADLMKKSLNLRQARHNMTASNLANIDTPNYRVRDLKFEKTMAEAVGRQEGRLDVMQTSGGHLPTKTLNDAYQVAQKNVVYGPYGQDETGQDVVDIDQEMTKLSKNHLIYNTTVQMLAKEFELLKYSITEGGR